MSTPTTPTTTPTTTTLTPTPPPTPTPTPIPTPTTPFTHPWIASYLSTTTPAPPLLDLRPLACYIRWHVAHATHLPPPLSAHLHELPLPRPGLRLGLLASTPAAAARAAAFLVSRGHAPPHILAEPALRRALPAACGPRSRPLWAPAPLLAAVLPAVLRALRGSGGSGGGGGGVLKAVTAAVEGGGKEGMQVEKEVEEEEEEGDGKGWRWTALDIGAGSGRNSAYMARFGGDVVAVDRDAGLLQKAEALARREPQGSVRGVTRTLGRHLGDDAAFLRRCAAGVVVVVRFLRRGVLDVLHEGVAEGGFVVYEHFLSGCEAFQAGPRKHSQMLRMGELAAVFSPARGFTVLRDEVERLPDGRPVVRFVARRDGRKKK